ncbi:MAG: amino acid transporter rane protein 2, family [Frankiales bacterium]|jgi:glutamate transport system permease protein|nr:amino acid transporter rane protein 2, family [Frankiales bacterium]
MSTLLAFSDPLGPRGRRKALVGSIAGGLVLLGLLGAALLVLADAGQLDGDRWSDLLSPDGFELYARGLGSTLRAAAVAIALAITVGTVMALGRLSTLAPVRWLATTYVQLFRALPSLLLIIFAFFALPDLLGRPVTRYSALVIGLTLYNSAVFAEIIRAGVLSLPRGQTEAAVALGLRRSQTQRLVILPQAVSRMLPSLVAQMVVVLKDTAYGSIIGYEELLRVGTIAGETTADVLQSYVIVAVIYIAVCFALSSVARWLEGRTTRRYGRSAAAGAVAVPGVEDLAVH